MAKFLIVIPPFTGHTLGTISIGTELITKGHTVAWIGVDNTPEKLIPNKGIWILIKKETKQIDELIKESKNNRSKSNIESIKWIYGSILIPLNRLMVTEIENTIDSYKPDIVINDFQAFSGAIAAYKKNIPYVTFITTPVENPEIEKDKTAQWKYEQLIVLQKEFGIYDKREINYSKLLNLVFCPNNFYDPSNLPNPFQFVGPVIKNRIKNEPFNLEKIKEGGNPILLISLGTLLKNKQRAFFEIVIQAFKDKPYTIVAVSDKELFEEWPDNFIVQKQIPQLEVLPFVDAVVTHGGANTTCESLYYGKPLVVLPMAYDQFYIASQIVESGCGIRLKSKRLKADGLFKAVNDVLKDDNYKLAAKKIQESFVKAGGTEKAVYLLEQVLVKIKEKQMIKSS